MRDDGVQFVMQVYREFFAAQKKSIVAEDIRNIAEQQGSFVRIFKKHKHQFEAVFSKEEGYLLGETVWHYFNKPDNLIFVEALPDRMHVILVVVRAGNIYLDRQVLDNDLRLELLPLMTERHKYLVVTSGPVSLTEKESSNSFTFTSGLVARYEKLNEPLTQRLPLLRNCKLQSLPAALRSQNLHRSSMLFPTMATLLVCSLCAWWLLFPHENAAIVSAPSAPKVNPLMAYEKAMLTPAPAQQLSELLAHINALYFAPGWQAKQIQFDGEKYLISLDSDGGDLSLLSKWARGNEYEFSMRSTGAQLQRKSIIEARKIVVKEYPLEKVAAALVDEVDALLQEKSIDVSETKMIDGMKQMNLTINLKNVSPDVLDLVGRELVDLPLALSQIDVTLQSGLINGSIQLSLWGT